VLALSAVHNQLYRRPTWAPIKLRFPTIVGSSQIDKITHQCVYYGGVAACRGRGGHLLVNAFQVPREEFGLLDIGLISELQRRLIEVLAVQPQAVFFRPPVVLG
jgi:hypothetical protein